MRRPIQFFLVPAILALVFAWAHLLTSLGTHQEQQKEKKRRETVAMVREANSICAGIMGNTETIVWEEIPIFHVMIPRTIRPPKLYPTNLADCVRLKLITEKDYQFLTNHRAKFHPFSETTPEDAVILELLDGEYWFSRKMSGSSKDWVRLTHDVAKK